MAVVIRRALRDPWWHGFFFALAILVATQIVLVVIAVPATPSQPRETPWVWLAPSPVGGGCVVFGDQLGTCFTVEAP